MTHEVAGRDYAETARGLKVYWRQLPSEEYELGPCSPMENTDCEEVREGSAVDRAGLSAPEFATQL